jgi:hypothetical protein
VRNETKPLCVALAARMKKGAASFLAAPFFSLDLSRWRKTLFDRTQAFRQAAP